MNTFCTERYFLVRIPEGLRVQVHISADQWSQVECVLTKTPCSMLHTLPGYTPAMRAEDERQIAAYRDAERKLQTHAPSAGE